ncbi:NAD(FAD)-dependent dehydrogenase, partial [Cupriavidus basilensis OR16]
QARSLRHAIAAHGRIALFASTRVIAAPASDTLLVEHDESAMHLPFRNLILCTGARELLLPFPGWTLPGVTGAGGLQALVKAGTPVRGERIVIAGSGPLLLAAAATARRHGAHVARIAEQAPLSRLTRFAGALWRWPSKAAQAVALLDRHYRTGSHVVEALGDERLRAVRIHQGDHIVALACDRLACGFGLVPNTGLAALLGCQLDPVSDAIAVNALQRTGLPHVYAAGECTGIGGSELALLEGRIAGYAAAGADDRAGLARWRRRVRAGMRSRSRCGPRSRSTPRSRPWPAPTRRCAAARMCRYRPSRRIRMPGWPGCRAAAAWAPARDASAPRPGGPCSAGRSPPRARRCLPPGSAH